MTIKNCAYAAGIAASLVLLAACGDDVTEVTQVSEKASLDQVEKFKKLPKCEEDIEGDLVYVKDSAKVFVCTGDGWISLDGKDGESGKDGKDGASGKDGKDGEAGKDGQDASSSACTVSEAKDGGFDVKCDGKTVGTIKNGKDGKDGESCSAKEVKDGYEIVCGGETIGTFKNGTVGKAGSDGDDCSLTEGKNGAVTVKCGSKTATLFKATCGTESYDPATHLCSTTFDPKTQKSVPVVIPRCKDQKEKFGDWFGDLKDYSEFPYDPNAFFCDGNGVLQPMCRWYDDETDEEVSKKYDPSKEYCDAQNKKISNKVPCANGSSYMRKPTEYCFTTNDNPKVQTAELLVCGSGNSAQTYSPVTHFCTKNTGVLDTMYACVKSGSTVDPFNIDIRYMANESIDDHTGQLCDTRDGQIYNTKHYGDHIWMVDLLRYAYKSGTADLDSSSFCYNNDCTQKNGVRAYLWSAVVDSAKLMESSKYCGYNEAPCTFEAPLQGICPDGWHVPLQEDLVPHSTRVSLNRGIDGFMAYQTNFDSSDPDADKKAMTWTTTPWFFWSGIDTDEKQAQEIDWEYLAYIDATSAAAGYSYAMAKRMALNVRCVKNSAAAAPAAGE